jgi:hypothetical protein
VCKVVPRRLADRREAPADVPSPRAIGRYGVDIARDLGKGRDGEAARAAHRHATARIGADDIKSASQVDGVPRDRHCVDVAIGRPEILADHLSHGLTTTGAPKSGQAQQ